MSRRPAPHAGGDRLRAEVGSCRGSPTSGTSPTGVSPVNIGRSPDVTLQRWNGGLDEVRVESVARSPEWIRAQNLSMGDTFVSFAPAACFSGCQALSVVDASGQITVTSANAFELVFSDSAGGHVDRFFDLDEDPTRTHDLAGGLSGQLGLFLDEIGWKKRRDKPAKCSEGGSRTSKGQPPTMTPSHVDMAARTCPKR